MAKSRKFPLNRLFSWTLRKSKRNVASVVDPEEDVTAQAVFATPEVEQPPASPTETQTLEVFYTLIKYFNQQQDVQALFHGHADVVFKDAPMTLEGFVDEWQRLFRSFPDFHIEYNDLKIVSPGCISVILQAQGTHTGEPYSFGPFPEVPMTGKHVKLDSEYVPPSSFCFVLLLTCPSPTVM